VIPGGESTVLTRLLMKAGTGPGCGAPWEPLPFHGAIRAFAQANPVMGTCAGLIMLARPCGDERVVPFDVLPVTVERNAYGRQTESFIEGIELDFPDAGLPKGNETAKPYPATFIRAPKITAVAEGVSVLARAKNASGGSDPVLVRHGLILGLTFHPELTPDDTRIHEYFLAMR
jgi:5'-phosphate synthase pdxT subunit